jgi:FkbM family methyltransferase
MVEPGELAARLRRIGSAVREELGRHKGLPRPRALAQEVMAAIYDRAEEGPPDQPAREIVLGGGLELTDCTGRTPIDPHSIGLMLRYLDPGDTMVDIGAGIGIYSVLAGAIIGRRGRVEALEPSPTVAPCLEANIERNGLINVRIHAKLAGARRAKLPFADGIGRSGRRRVPGRREWVRQQHLLQIPSVQIDELMVGRRCSLMRIDAAGYELRVLEGAEELLRRPHPPSLLIAVEEAALADFGHTPRQLLGWLAARDYETCFYDGEHHRILHAGMPWKLNRMLFAFPQVARNDISRRLARRADDA